MESIWLSTRLSNEIINNKHIVEEIQSIISDIISERITILQIIEYMGGVLTDKDVENREKGMKFFTNLLKALPNEYLTETQVKFISKFYIDRLKDHHKVIPDVIEGYLYIINMKHYNIHDCVEFFTMLFREVSCQSQVRQDRYNMYLILDKLLDKDLEYMKTLGPDFVYGVISSIDGERDPRNLLFLFTLLPKFLTNIPLGHLVEEMFDVISCYYPIDFHPSPNDPAAVTRQELANALSPCLCAIPEFGEHCLVLLIEKLDSSLRLAKIDSLKLLAESCKKFKTESYGPFLKTLWASIYREISHKSDDELRMAAHEALSALVAKLATSANTDQSFENFVKGVLISMQTIIADATTVAQFVQATKVVLTAANSSKESCVLITRSMIPAMIAYYGFKTSPKLQIASIEFLGDLYNLSKHWEVLDQINAEVKEIPELCLTAVSQTAKEYQIIGFKTLIIVEKILQSELVLPFVEVLIHTIQHSLDNDLLSTSVQTVHVIAKKYPELIMSIVVKGKCDLDNITSDKTALQKRLNLLTNLASIDDFTKVIIEEMLRLITSNDKEASKVIEAMNESMSNSDLYSDKKVTEIESDHGLVDSVITWLFKEIEQCFQESLYHGYMLVSNTIGSLPPEKQEKILFRHTQNVLDKCKTKEIYYLILECLYNSIDQSVYNDNFEEILLLSLRMSLASENEMIRSKACVLIAHFLNKAEYSQKFEILYELLKSQLSSLSKEDPVLCPKLIMLYGWITKALVMRGSDTFLFWLKKITIAIASPEYCKDGSEAIRIIMTDFPDRLNVKNHCRISLLYKQRIFQTFSEMLDKFDAVNENTKEAYMLSWAYVLKKAPKSIILNEANKIAPLVIDSLILDNKDLLLVMIDILCNFVQTKHIIVTHSLQTIMPRLISLSKYVKSMDVRIKSLQCLFDIANCYPTMFLLPHKQDTLLELAPSLDDKKRLVRNMAVRARTRWFLVGAPGESKAD